MPGERNPKWRGVFVGRQRNWQTRGTQNPVRGNSGVGSIPSTGTNYLSEKLNSYDGPIILSSGLLSFRPKP
jgi:hypothetical protein